MNGCSESRISSVGRENIRRDINLDGEHILMTALLTDLFAKMTINERNNWDWQNLMGGYESLPLSASSPNRLNMVDEMECQMISSKLLNSFSKDSAIGLSFGLDSFLVENQARHNESASTSNVSSDNSEHFLPFLNQSLPPPMMSNPDDPRDNPEKIDAVSPFPFASEASLAHCMFPEMDWIQLNDGKSALKSGLFLQPGRYDKQRYKTELCSKFLTDGNGHCEYGPKCQYAHGMHELRLPSKHPKYKTSLCVAFHSLGVCPYGRRCDFIHNETKEQLRRIREMIYAFHEYRRRYPYKSDDITIFQLIRTMMPHLYVNWFNGNQDKLPSVAHLTNRETESMS